MNILLAVSNESDAWVQQTAAALRREMPEREVVFPGEPFDRRMISYVAAWRHKPGSIANLPTLEAIFSLGAGVDSLWQDERLPADVAVYRVAQNDLTFRMSEYVLLHCLLHLRDQRRYDHQQRDRNWNVGRVAPLAGDVRVGIMGMGVLGCDAAKKLTAIGFDVSGWARTAKSDAPVPVFAGAEQFDAFLARTDILVALLPLTDATRGILNMTLFEKLARDGRLGAPVLINAGRGGLQVEADILNALDMGLLKAVTLDVFETEPLSQNSPLWTHPAVTVTPHNAASSDPVATAHYIAHQIRRIEAGEEAPGRVNRQAGY